MQHIWITFFLSTSVAFSTRINLTVAVEILLGWKTESENLKLPLGF